MVALLRSTCAPLPEAKTRPAAPLEIVAELMLTSALVPRAVMVLLLFTLVARMSRPLVVASNVPALTALASPKSCSVAALLALMVPLLTTAKPPPKPMMPAPAIVLFTLLKTAPLLTATMRLFPLGDGSETWPPPLSTTAPEIARVEHTEVDIDQASRFG